MVSTKILSSSTENAPNQHIKIISEESCGTEH